LPLASTEARIVSEERFMNLTREQRAAVGRGETIEVTVDDNPCVVVRSDVFARVRRLSHDDGEWTADELREGLARAAEANGWNHPSMDDYDRYDEARAATCP
jgi:hypothetical protein